MSAFSFSSSHEDSPDERRDFFGRIPTILTAQAKQAVDQDVKIRLPRSATRAQQGYLKLLQDVDRRARSGFDYYGCFLRPGAIVDYRELHPSSDYPETPVLLEYAGCPRPVAGWRRHDQGDVWILWTLAGTEWREVMRVCVPGPEWAELMRDAARRELRPAVLSPADVRARIRALIERELSALSDADQGFVAALLHDEFAARMAVGRQVQELHTYPPSGLRVFRK